MGQGSIADGMTGDIPAIRSNSYLCSSDLTIDKLSMKTGTGDIFLEKLKKEIDDNLTNDQFSVEELAKNIGMSRSQLHRKLNSATGQSVSQFIREHRLQLGMALLFVLALYAAVHSVTALVTLVRSS